LPTSSSLRAFAEEPAAWGEIDPRSGLERLLTDRYCLLLGPVPSFTQVSRLRLDPDTLAETIHEVREEIAARGHTRATWDVASSATPGDLVDRLLAHGFVFDDHQSSLLLTKAPAAAPAEIAARRIESLEEFLLAADVSARAFGTPPERTAEWDAIAEERFALERAGHAPRAYLAFADGRAIGSAQSLVEPGCPGALLIGGAVLPEARGRGAYRALVRARWDDAVASGFDALCVHARQTSRPILERLGFELVAEHEILGDPATC
jgi:GNAT superfamily N-acetyltransferase